MVAVDGSVKTGGETSWVSWAYGPIAKIEAGPPGENILADTGVKDSVPAGDCATEGGSD